MPICYLVPGLAGTELNTADTGLGANLWVNRTRLALCHFVGLTLAPNGTDPAPIFGQACTPGVPLAPYQDQLLATLRADRRLDGWTFSQFGYDWRKQCRGNGALLAARIRAEATADDPCTIVAHSMGGIVARAAWYSLGGPADQARVRRIVTLGTPHRGSYSIPVLWSGTEEILLQVHWIKSLVNASLNLAGVPQPIPYLSPADLVSVTTTWPSCYELLPLLDAHAEATDSLRILLYGPPQWPADRHVSAAWLDYSQHDFGPWLKNPASMPPPWVLTSVGGYGLSTGQRLVTPRLMPGVNAYGFDALGDNRVSLDSAQVLDSATFAVPGIHGDLQANQHVLNRIVDWILDERHSPDPAPPPVTVQGGVPPHTPGPPLPIWPLPSIVHAPPTGRTLSGCK